MRIREKISDYYWNNSILSSKQKERIVFYIRRKLRRGNKSKIDTEFIEL